MSVDALMREAATEAPESRDTATRATAPSNDIVLDDAGRQRVPDGVYEAVYIRHETAISWRTPRVYIWMRLVTPGPHMGVELYRAYRVASLIGRPGRSGRFKLRRGHELCAMLVRVLDIRVRPDRFSPCALGGRVLQVKTRTVIKDHAGRPLHDWLRYSVIDDIITATTGI